MSDSIQKKLADIISKIPKKDLAKNLEKAKNILKNSNKDDLKKLLKSKQVQNIVGNNKEELSKAIDNTDLKKIDLDSLK